ARRSPPRACASSAPSPTSPPTPSAVSWSAVSKRCSGRGWKTPPPKIPPPISAPASAPHSTPWTHCCVCPHPPTPHLRKAPTMGKHAAPHEHHVPNLPLANRHVSRADVRKIALAMAALTV